LLIGKFFLLKFFTNNVEGTLGFVLYAGVTIIAMAPFVNALMIAGLDNFINTFMASGINTKDYFEYFEERRRNARKKIKEGKIDKDQAIEEVKTIAMEERKEVMEKWNAFDSSHRFGAVCIIVVKQLIPMIMFMIVLSPIFHFKDDFLTSFFASLLITIFIRGIRSFRYGTRKIEERFKYNLSDKIDTTVPTVNAVPAANSSNHPHHNHPDHHKILSNEIKEELRKRSIHIERVEVPINYPSIGKTLGDLNFRNTTGVSIVSIIRGEEVINIPDRQTKLFPFDTMIIVGSDEEIQYFTSIFEKKQIEKPVSIDATNYRVELSQYVIEAGNSLIDNTIANLHIQKKTNCLITSIERDGTMITKFSGDFKFKQNDILWVAGEKQKILDFESALFSNEKNFIY
jgi:CPA2 family monovalent cation:H+ antiporter-2